MGYSFTDLGAEGCCCSLNALFNLSPYIILVYSTFLCGICITFIINQLKKFSTHSGHAWSPMMPTGRVVVSILVMLIPDRANKLWLVCHMWIGQHLRHIKSSHQFYSHSLLWILVLKVIGGMMLLNMCIYIVLCIIGLFLMRSCATMTWHEVNVFKSKS